MSTPANCPKCGAPLPTEALQGLCPACLLQQGGLGDTEPGPALKSFEPPPVAELAKLFPQLEILEFIGRGGMGAVYKARQPALDRFVALKILPPAAGGGSEFGERFNREARALARLSHPNIVAVYDFGQSGGLPFFIMEYVDGANLRALERSRRVAPREALQIIPQICDALQYAHDEGVVHRDIKPENVLVDRRGRIKIADFGLAKILGRNAEELRLTGEGQVMGTPHYMAPEQVEAPLQVDHRADIYALGVVLYEMLTGELPLGRFPPPSNRVSVDVRFDQVVLRALEKQPELRYQHASQVKSDVETISHTSAPIPRDHAGTDQAREAAAGGAVTPSGTVMLSSPRLSRKALIGACWAMFFFVAGALSLMTSEVRVEGTSPPVTSIEWWRYLLIFTVLVPGLTAPFGTTLLGWVAVPQIRRSAGRLYGLGLAVFDGLLFPLLILDGLIFWAWKSVLQIVAGLFGVSSHTDPWSALIILGGILLSAVADFYICRKVWRAVKEPLPASPPSPLPRAGSRIRPVAVALAVAAMVVGLLGLGFLLSGGFLVQRQLGRSIQGIEGELHRATLQPGSGLQVARLPRQGLVELIALADPNAVPRTWWRPDGVVLGPNAIETSGLGKIEGASALERDILVRLNDLPEGATGPQFDFGEPVNWTATRSVRMEGQPLEGAWALRAGWGSASGTKRFRVGLAFESWRAVAVYDPVHRSMERIERHGEPGWTVMFHQLLDQETNCLVTLVFGPSGKNWDHRVVAVDSDDLEHLSRGSSGSVADRLETRTYTFPGLSLAQVKEFRVQVRPFYWVEFRGMALESRPETRRPLTTTTYGPIRQRDVGHFIDFDRDRLAEMPDDATRGDLGESIARGVAWLEREGMDAEAASGRLLAFGMTVQLLPNDDWQQLTALALSQLLGQAPQSKEPEVEIKPVKEGQLPVTYGFRTREGGIGMLQIVALKETDPGLTLRYKLVQ